MAHVTFHFAIGLAVGSFVMLPMLFRPWLRGDPLARPLAGWLLAAYAFGLWAVLPNLVRHAGLDWTGGWTNIFLLHAYLDDIEDGGMLLGQVGMAACFFVQYVLLCLAIRRADTGAQRASITC